MIKFILKAFKRDKNRSLIPIIVVTAGVFLTISLIGFIRGTLGDMIDMTANFQTGHIKITTRAYAENSEQMPNDLCLLDIDQLQSDLATQYPNYEFKERILFGGLLDRSDKQGNTLGQGAASIMAVDLKSDEVDRLNIKTSIVKGGLPSKANEILIADNFASKLGVGIGDTVNFMGSTMNGSLSFALYTISGTLKFGNAMMDKSMVIMNLPDARQVMDMNNAASMLLGYSKDNMYHDAMAIEMSDNYNAQFANDDNEFLPFMQPLRAQNSMGNMLDQTASFSSSFIVLFIIVMAVVLWNMGLLAGLRRYQEFGIRLALGESKSHIYRSQIFESMIIGVVGSVFGTALGLSLVYYMQTYGFDISSMMPDGGSMMMPSILRARLSADLLVLGFIPGLGATTLGAMLSAKGIYKRQTATLMKELEI